MAYAPLITVPVVILFIVFQCSPTTWQPRAPWVGLAPISEQRGNTAPRWNSTECSPVARESAGKTKLKWEVDEADSRLTGLGAMATAMRRVLRFLAAGTEKDSH
jgi:hypothetical protein